MSFETLLEPLRRVALFQGLKPIQITEIARRAERMMFRDGDTIIREDGAGDAAYLIVAGDAVRIGGPAPLGTLATGTLIGEMAMLVETAYTSTVVCKGPVRALKINRDAMLEQMREDASLADHLVEQLAGRLKILAEDLRKVDAALAPQPAAVSEQATVAAMSLQVAGSTFELRP
jgi:CRP-like cAMP-binding protein